MKNYRNPYIFLTIGPGYVKFSAVADSFDKGNKKNREYSGSQPYSFGHYPNERMTPPRLTIALDYVLAACNNWAGRRCSYTIAWENREVDKQVEYLYVGGDACPNCGERYNLEGDSFDTADGIVSQEVGCPDCGSTWTSHYRLAGISDLEVGDDDDEVPG